jgi:hypothetical protein
VLGIESRTPQDPQGGLGRAQRRLVLLLVLEQELGRGRVRAQHADQ